MHYEDIHIQTIIFLPRDVARNRNIKRYFTGIICEHGHISERYTKSTLCVECGKQQAKRNKEKIRKYQKQWRIDNKTRKQRTDAIWQKNNKPRRDIVSKKYVERNKKRISEYKHQWYLNNKERVAERNFLNRLANKEKKKEYDKARHNANPEIAKIARLKRRLSEKQAIPSWYESQRDKIHTIYKKRDELSKLWGIELHVDHIIPLRGKLVSGLHCWDNLQLLEASINLSKSNTFKP